MSTTNIRVVMIETSHPGNIGAAARAMKNMNFAEMVLVNPEEFPSPKATARAVGADDILENARVVSSLDEALEGCHLVVGTSARLRSTEYSILDPRQTAHKVAEISGEQNVALLFGRESSGLRNIELDRCHHLVHIPTNPDFSSLNVGAAIQVICYEIYYALQSLKEASPLSAEEPPVAAEKLQAYFERLESTLIGLGFCEPGQNELLMRRLRRLYLRANPTQTELDMLHGILSAAEGSKYRWMKDRLDLLTQELQAKR